MRMLPGRAGVATAISCAGAGVVLAIWPSCYTRARSGVRAATHVAAIRSEGRR